jgi:hypothetical protein
MDLPPIIPIEINPYGHCTLVSLTHIPTELNLTFRKLKETAITLYDLEEFPPLSIMSLTDLAHAVATKLATYDVLDVHGVSIWVSGSFIAFPIITINTPNQERVECVTSIELFFFQSGQMVDKSVKKRQMIDFGFEIEPVDLPRGDLGDDYVFGLFLGGV